MGITKHRKYYGNINGDYFDSIVIYSLTITLFVPAQSGFKFKVCLYRYVTCVSYLEIELGQNIFACGPGTLHIYTWDIRTETML